MAGIERGQVCLGNAIRCRPSHQDKLPPISDPKLREAITHCQRVYGKVPDSVRLFVAEGEYAMWALTGEEQLKGEKGRTLSSWRGYVLPYHPITERGPGVDRVQHSDVFTPREQERKVLVVYHTAYTLRTPWEKPVALSDWQKVGKIIRGTWPQPMPKIQRWSPAAVYAKEFAFDTEFTEDRKLIRYSLAHELLEGPTLLWVIEGSHVKTVHAGTGTAAIMQNVEADVEYLNMIFGGVRLKVHDTMYAHAVLWPDLDHDLNFGGSLYARTNRWKHLVNSNPVVYSGGDALGTLDWHLGMAGEFARDPQSYRVYESYMLPLLPIIANAKRHGIRVATTRAKQAAGELLAKMNEAEDRARAYVGWPISLGSPHQVAHWLWEWEKLKRRGQ